MNFGSVSKVSLELSIKLDLNHELTFCHVCSLICCEIMLPAMRIY